MSYAQRLSIAYTLPNLNTEPLRARLEEAIAQAQSLIDRHYEAIDSGSALDGGETLQQVLNSVRSAKTSLEELASYVDENRDALNTAVAVFKNEFYEVWRHLGYVDTDIAGLNSQVSLLNSQISALSSVAPLVTNLQNQLVSLENTVLNLQNS